MSSSAFDVQVQCGPSPDADPVVDRDLDAFLDGCPTSFAQQTTGWRDVISHVGEDESHFLVARQGGEIVGLLPMYRFAGSRGVILTSVPQPGPLGGAAIASGMPREPVMSALMTACFELASSKGCDLVSIISNPFWNDRKYYQDVRQPDYVLENSLLALDLHEVVDSSGALVKASTSVRRNLRVANKAGLVIDEEQSQENVDCWASIHECRHREIGATPIPRAFFRAVLKHAVPAGCARFFFVRSEDSGEMISGGLYLCHGSVVDAYMPSMDSRFADLRPNYLLAAHSIAWAKSQGYRYYNWQGSPPGGGVERFKRSFGSEQFDYSFLTWVTGDAKPFLDSKLGDWIDEYRFHYVLPFDQIGKADGGEPDSQVVSARGDAWDAMEQNK